MQTIAVAKNDKTWKLEESSVVLSRFTYLATYSYSAAEHFTSMFTLTSGSGI
jgi:hypothetical protein